MAKTKAEEICWTPCKHFKQCIGFCPYCLAQKLGKTQAEADVAIKKGYIEGEYTEVP